MLSKGKLSKSLDRGLNYRKSLGKSKKNLLPIPQSYNGYPPCTPSQKTGYLPIKKTDSYHELKGSCTNIDTDDQWLRRTLQSDENLHCEDEDADPIYCHISRQENNNNNNGAKTHKRKKSNWGKYFNLFSSSGKAPAAKSPTKYKSCDDLLNGARNSNRISERNNSTNSRYTNGHPYYFKNPHSLYDPQRSTTPSPINPLPQNNRHLNNNITRLENYTENSTSVLPCVQNGRVPPPTYSNVNNEPFYQNCQQIMNVYSNTLANCNTLINNNSSSTFSGSVECKRRSPENENDCPGDSFSTPITLYNELNESIAYIIYERPVSSH